jgi:hypothetical protein
MLPAASTAFAIWHHLYHIGTSAGLTSFRLLSTSIRRSKADIKVLVARPASNAATAAATACPTTAVTQLSPTTVRPMALRLSAGRSASAIARRCAATHQPSAAGTRCFAAVSSRHAVRLAPEPPNMRVRVAWPLLTRRGLTTSQREQRDPQPQKEAPIVNPADKYAEKAEAMHRYGQYLMSCLPKYIQQCVLCRISPITNRPGSPSGRTS